VQYHLGFVLEQELGHKTHALNIASRVAEDPEIVPSWFPLTIWDTEKLLPVIGKNWTIRSSRRSRDLIRRELKTKQLSALFFHTQSSTIFSVGLMRRIPSVISLDATSINIDEIAEAYNHVARPGSPIEELKRLTFRRAFRAAKLLITWNHWAKNSLINDYGIESEKIHVIDPGVDLGLWSGLGLDRPVNRPRPRILFAGMDFKRKGGDLLLQIFRDNFRDIAELHILTRVPIPPEPGVHVYTDLTSNDPRLRRLFGEADLFVLPTLGECSPRVIPEAMAARLPTISTKVGAIPEMIDEGRTGYLIAPGDGIALRDAIARLIADPALRRSMGEAGWAEAAARFDSRRNNDHLLSLLKGIARPEPAPTTAGFPAVSIP